MADWKVWQKKAPVRGPMVAFCRHYIALNKTLAEYVQRHGFEYAEIWFREDLSEVHIVLLKMPSKNAYRVRICQSRRGLYGVISARAFSRYVRSKRGMHPDRVEIRGTNTIVLRWNE